MRRPRLAAFGLGVVDGVEHGGGEEGEVLDVAGGVVEDFGVDEGELGAADAVGFHLLELAEDFGFFDGGAEPPPADHGAGVGGWVGEVAEEVRGGLREEGGGSEGEGEEEGSFHEVLMVLGALGGGGAG